MCQMDHEDMAVFGLAEIKRLACTEVTWRPPGSHIPDHSTHVTRRPAVELASSILPEVGRCNFFWVRNRNSATRRKHFPQSQFRNFLKKCCSATTTPQFRNQDFFWSPQLQVRNLRASIPLFSEYLWPWNPVDSWKISEIKNLVLRQVFGFQRNSEF